MLEELNKFISFLKYKDLSSMDKYLHSAQFQKDREKLHTTYDDIITGKATLLSEDEYNEQMDGFIKNLKEKHANNER